MGFEPICRQDAGGTQGVCGGGGLAGFLSRACVRGYDSIFNSAFFQFLFEFSEQVERPGGREGLKVCLT